MSNYELTDYQWEQIEDLFPPKTSKCGRARRDPRELMNAIIWVGVQAHLDVSFWKNMDRRIQSIIIFLNR